MKRKICWLKLAVINLLLFTSLVAQAAVPVSNLTRIDLKPGTLSTKIILQTDTPTIIERAVYLSQIPPILAVELANSRPVELASIINFDNRLIKSVKIEPQANDLRLLFVLSEKVPYRLSVENGKPVIELNEFLRSKEYIIDPSLSPLIKPESQVQFTGLNINNAPGQVTVKIGLSGEAPIQAFALENPNRLVIDLLNTQYQKPIQAYQVDKANVEKLRIGQFKISDPCPITRLVFDLKDASWYSLDTSRNGLAITFYAPAEALVAENKIKDSEKPKRETVSASMANALPVLETTRMVKETPATEAEAALLKPQPVENKKTAEPEPKIAKETQAKPQQRQEDKFKPRVIQTTEEKYSGEIISLKFKDADLRDVILFLADFAGLNVIFDPGVRGTITMNLQEVPWDQALEIILKQHKLGKIIEGNVLRIAPVDVLAREDEEMRRLKESKELAGPMQVKTITLSYSKARDVQNLLKSKLSKSGEIVIDERTNTLIISEVKDRMELLEKLISVLDTPTPQVSIEARIVEATSTFIRNLGIQWGYKGIVDPFYGNQTAIQFPNKMLADGSMIPQGIVTKGIGGPLGGYAINLPAPAFNTAIGFSFANVLDTFRLDVALSGLETSGQGRIISSPKVTTQNNQPAEIVQGRQIPVQTVANFTVTTRYVNAALELRATPQITAEGTIIMNIEIQNNAADFANLVNGIPPITTQSAKTTVMVPDGGTTVIGGIYRTEDSITRDRVPYLHSIPILGNLFRSFARTRQNRELLIFITPRIIK
ncbi:MAG: type IV pilus secretin PilQ [Candidatus Aminicenantes bacterium]|nr:type IV pilus secretin PilQ [Candidatus Aminicenantes bacterium]